MCPVISDRLHSGIKGKERNLKSGKSLTSIRRIRMSDKIMNKLIDKGAAIFKSKKQFRRLVIAGVIVIMGLAIYSGQLAAIISAMK